MVKKGSLSDTAKRGGLISHLKYFCKNFVI